jgi:uncharacterized protein YbjT (DUF2867 family)
MTNIDPRPVLVLGGTGHYGRRIVAALAKSGARVRVVSRGAAAARALLGETVDVVEGDVTSPGVTRSALVGARAVVIALAAMNRTAARQLRAIERDAVLRTIEEARAVGVHRLVYLSGYEIRIELIERLGLRGPFGLKAEVEEALRQSDLDWTILGEAFSMEIFFAMIRGDAMSVPGGGPPAIPTVAPDDAGIISAQAALRDDLGGQRFHVTGPEALSFPEAARRIGEVLGRPMRFRAIPLPPMRAVLRVAGLFNPYFDYLRASVVLLNNFPQDLAAGVPEAHRRLVETFDYVPITLEMETRRRVEAGLV